MKISVFGLGYSEVIVIGTKSPEFTLILRQVRPGQVVIDLVRLLENIDNWDVDAQYKGICW